MSTQHRFTAAERAQHIPDDCQECGHRMKANWAPDTRPVDKHDMWIVSEVCTNPDCPRGPKRTVR